ncbi:MAG: SgcJ/EcaC family oxidoreductase [Planctomycetales bacterium]|nr:SgcJ/EcaC family oxidoreductase [Planctomycetales bacterium]
MRNNLCLVLYMTLVMLGQGTICCIGQEAESPEAGGDPPAQRSDSSAELAAIRAGSEAFVEAFNTRDAKAVAALWTEGGEYSDESGRSFVGRDAIEAGYAQFFAEGPKVTMRVMIDSLRMLSDGAAIEDGRAVIDPPPAGAPAISKYTVVHVKVDGKWLMASVRDSRIETPSAFRNVADLEWLIGTWIAEEHGATITSVCNWLANKSFVERRYTSAHADGTETSGVQLIGWNPMDGHVQSWDFSPDGGHAVGLWSPREGGWIAEMRGVTGDGAETTSVNTLTRLDDNAYVWQSVQRTMGGIELDDTGEVVLKRQ